ncbi:MAG: sulfatase-like hydrolase/transferase [Planctomycetota bacterium]|nr:sulfatase-like hydrolase/transferase [Planctomycetota bacterium]
MRCPVWMAFVVVFVLSWMGSSSLLAQSESVKPNIIIIMADDLGYGDIGCYGNQRIKTPNLDRMAKQGLRFTDFHSSGTVCSPTRCGLLTGRYQQRAGIPAVVSVKHKQLGMAQSEITFAEVLRKKGYATALYGKWHLGYQKKFNPVKQGFDAFRGYVSGNVDFFSHVDQSGAFDWWRDDELQDEEGYTTHLITRHAVDFINLKKKEPFCLYLAHEAPHYPYQGPNDQAERTVGGKFTNQGSRKDVAKAYKEMVETLDQGVGEVLAALQKNGLMENTLVWFFSDNGANPKGNNGGLKGFKGSVWEGGHRVPSIAYWPGKINPGSVTNQLAITLDVFPTLVSIAKASDPLIPKLDGLDLSPTLLNAETTLQHRILFWGAGKQRAMRIGKWKLVSNAKGQGGRTALFDLAKDRAEKTDIASAHGKKVQEMRNAIKAWDQEVGPSAFAAAE